MADRYTLQRSVGHGASGAVWLAHDEVLRRSVALKRVGPTGGADDAVRAEREARLAAQVAHPHVVAVYDLVIDDDGSWLVMEYVDGPTLATVVRETGALDPDRAARLLAPVTDALVQAHALGIVHRDIKPSNILAPGDGGAKLSDFGIARGAEDATLTRTGLVTGSPAYLAPEVATGGQATPASDVWAVGATIAHLLTGQPPYHREGEDNGPLAVVYRIVHEEPPHPGLAGWLAPLLASTMSKDPDLRPTMAQVRDQLEHVGSPVQTMSLPAVPQAPPAQLPQLPPPTPLGAPTRSAGQRRPPWPAVAAAAAVVAAVLTLVVILAGRDESPDPAAAPGTGETSSTESADEEVTPPTAEEMQAFAEEYVRTADADPAAGFAMLTPAYQASSEGYEDFWGPMRNPKILEISADPDAMTVTYTYRYSFPSKGSTTETVTLDLLRDGDRLLIDGAQ